MIWTLNFRVLTCLVLCTSCVHAIKVTFGTKNGPIEPPTPEPLPSPQPYRTPAPVWEERSDDSPDPNVHWRPQLFKPQPRYTKIMFAAPTPVQQSESSALRFVNAYRPAHEPIQAQPVKNYFTPTQFLSSQSLPGIGLRYFVPAYVSELQAKKEQNRQEDAKHNAIETNEVGGPYKESSTDLLWKHEKNASKRHLRNTFEGTARPFYVWPAYVQPRH